MSVLYRIASKYSPKATAVLALGSLIGGGLVRLLTPSSFVLSAFVGLLACLLLCAFLVSLGQRDPLTWHRVLTYPLGVLGLWSVPPPASPASLRGNLFVVSALAFAGFVLVQYILQ